MAVPTVSLQDTVTGTAAAAFLRMDGGTIKLSKAGIAGLELSDDGEGSIVATIGGPGQPAPELSVWGQAGTGRVYDALYNPPIYCVADTFNSAAMIDIFQGASFLPILSIPVPAAFQAAKLYRVSLQFASTYDTGSLNATQLTLVASSAAAIAGLAPADALSSVEAGSTATAGQTPVQGAGILSVAFATVQPTLAINVFLVATGNAIQPGTITNTSINYVLEAIN